jgi:guanine deaminase
LGIIVYENYGLVGPKFSGSHGIWLSDSGSPGFQGSAAIAFYPCSNLFLSSGLSRISRATDGAARRLSFSATSAAATASRC